MTAPGYQGELPVCLPAERAAPGHGEVADDEVVGVLDHVLDDLLGQRSVEDHGVPVPLVQVISGDYRRVCLSQRLGEARLTLETRRDSAPNWERANIFPATLNTEVLGPNGNVSSAPLNERR